MSCEGKINTKERDKEQVGETVCFWIFTTSHFFAKGNLASENMEIVTSYKVTPQKEENKINVAEGLLKRHTVILEGIRSANA